jgi:hypothetical protein
MNPIQPSRNFLVVMLLLSAGLLFLGPEHARAQQTCNATPFLAVTSWTASVSIIGQGSGTVTDANGVIHDYNISQSIQLQSVLTPSPTGPFSGPENAVINVNETFKDTILDPTAGPLVTTTTIAANGTSPSGFFGQGAGLSIGALPMACGYSYGADYNFSPFTTTVTTSNGTSSSQALGAWGAPNIPNMLEAPGTIAAPQGFVLFPSSGTTLSGSVTFVSPPWLDNEINPTVIWTVTWSFSPTPEALDVAVTIPNYLSWRPSAGRNEQDLGITPLAPPNLLGISAQLVDKKTQQPTPFGPDKMTFSVVDVSRQPGVAMNWPAKANLITPAAPLPDMSFMSFDPTITLNQGFHYDDVDGTVADFTPQDPSLGNPTIDILLAPYDWGGWGTLNVTANVGGATIQGHLVVLGIPTDLSETNILLPNRQPNSSIADSWKAAHGAVGLADDDDSESNPVGDLQPGDGLTLYEEYRGFYLGRGCGANRVEPQPEGTPGAACQHVEGDPKIKDIFIVNRIGAQGIDGIGLFQFGSGLNVHYRGLQLAEVGPQGDPSYRVINFNNLGLPLHKVDQHAVILDWGDKREEGTLSGDVPTADAPGGLCGYLPKHSDHLEINQDLLEPAYQASTGSRYSEMETTVAHELSHAVDVCHHGDGVDHYEVWFVDPNTKEIMEQTLGNDNTTPVGTPSSITVVDEEQLLQPVIVGLTGFDLGLEDSEGKPLPGSNPYRVGNRLCNSIVALNGESSGDVLDFMRYDDTIAFIPSTLPDVRVRAFDFASGNGVDLTDHPIGTGVNAPGRKPLSRFGDADTAHQRGNDRSQVDVNDSKSEIARGNFVCQ